MTPALLVTSKQKQYLYKRHKKHQQFIDFMNEYKTYNNKLNKFIDNIIIAKREDESKGVKIFKNNTKNFELCKY